MRIILFGGSFNPIHNGHIQAAKLAMKRIGAKKVIFLPNYESFDQKENDEYVDPMDRYNMIKEVIKNVPEFYVDDYEIKQGKKCYTIDTIEHFRRIYFADDIYILIGYDQLLNFHKWKDYERIMELASIICVKRAGIEIEKSNFSIHDFVFIDFSYNDINSSSIRKELVINDVPYKALKYINENGLYAKSRLLPFISKKRFNHSLRVALMAYEIMQKYDKKNAIKGWVAGIYHDICKEFGKEKIEDLAYNKYGLEQQVSWKVLHGPVGARFIRDLFKMDDEMVMSAIENHTIPNADRSTLTILDKVLFCCDKLEPARTEKDLKDIDKIRKLLYVDLNKTFDTIINTLAEMYPNSSGE